MTNKQASRLFIMFTRLDSMDLIDINTLGLYDFSLDAIARRIPWNFLNMDDCLVERRASDHHHYPFRHEIVAGWEYLLKREPGSRIGDPENRRIG
jgi:hypothetical protein